MDETDKKIRELTEAMRAEQDARIRNRMMAVRGILAGYPTKDAAYFADVDRRTVQLWMARFDEGGIGGLRDAPGRSRASRARYVRIRKLADRLAGKNMLTPSKLRNWIRGKLNARYSLCSVSRILRLLRFSSKRSTTEYASAADSDAVRQWQAGAAGTISWVKKRGFAVVVQDESIFIRIGANGRKLWSRVGEPVAVIRYSRRDRTVVYGALAEDGIRLMRQYERFDGNMSRCGWRNIATTAGRLPGTGTGTCHCRTWMEPDPHSDVRRRVHCREPAAACTYTALAQGAVRQTVHAC